MKVLTNYTVMNRNITPISKVKNNIKKDIGDTNVSFQGFRTGLGAGMIGTLVGFALGGPIGAVVGAGIAGAAGGAAKENNNDNDPDLNGNTDYTMDDYPSALVN